jgi:bis(5'-nucleosyl)-tetraphosphatase (symmetrical)
MIYLIGDVQGCCDALEQLLLKLDFSPSRDQLFVLGDLVNRGPQSLAVLERLMRWGASARCVLGNHDLHLLAVAHGIRPASRGDTLHDVLASPLREALLDWLRHRPLALQNHGWLMVHAGVLPQWDAAQTLALAEEVSQALRGPYIAEFLRTMYGNQPAQWSPALQGPERARVIINALTRVRFMNAQGVMDFDLKEGSDTAPPGLMPWFDAPGRKTAGQAIAFGHWSTLGPLDRPDLMALDSGCVWGGALTAARIDGGRRERISIPCTAAQTPTPPSKAQRTV